MRNAMADMYISILLKKLVENEKIDLYRPGKNCMPSQIYFLRWNLY